VDYQAFWESFEVTSRGWTIYVLEGPAVATTKENYAMAVELLRDRYGNKFAYDSMLKIMFGHSFQNWRRQGVRGFLCRVFLFRYVWS